MTSPTAAPPAARPPRVRKVPAYATSAGAEAVDLAASAGLLLDDWQADTLTDALGERPDGTWSAFEVGLIVPRQNGKGAVIEARELAGLFLFGERLILHSAHEFKTAQEAFRRLLGLVEGTDDLRRRVSRIRTSHGEEGIELFGGQRLRFVARSTGSGRGFTGDCVILDEAYALTAEEMAALLPTMSARPNPQLWYTSTPPKDPAAMLTSLRSRGASADEGRLAYFEYGAEGPVDAIDLDDRRLWADTNPALGIRISEEFVANERDALKAAVAEFARERLGVWPPSVDGEWQVITEAAWSARADPESTLVDPVALAVDVTPDRSWAVIGAAGAREDGSLGVEVIDHRRGTGWVGTRMKTLTERWKPCAVVVDAGGPAGSLLADLEKALRRGMEVTKPSAREAGQACGALWDGLCGDTPTVWHLDQAPLNTAVAGARKRPLGDAWAWDRRSVSVDISPLVAVTLAAWGYATRPPEEDPVVPLVAWR